ncbi:MAG: hypothetical protein J6S26_01035 [Solobacterium sp.]|nr:hypothetical protein [Solobacterium sp.]
MSERRKALQAYCAKYIPVLRMIAEDEELTEACLDHDLLAYEKKHRSVIRYLHRELIREAMEENLFPGETTELVRGNAIEEWVAHPEETALMDLDADHVAGCIAWHFHRDPLSFMEFIRETVGKGYLLRMMEVLRIKLEEESAV